ncbi:MAG TPA: retropepsin-like aspartic protease [Rhizomicrobium sp.]|jgi:predicted aspartyl protease
MRKALLIAALLSSTLAQAEPCGLQKMAAFDIQGLSNGRIEIPITIADKPFIVMVDTGAPLGILDADVADQIGLKRQKMPGRYEFYSLSGEGPTQFAVVPSLKLGQSEAHYTDFLIATFTGRPDNLAGTIGADLLKNFDVEFDFENQKINLFSQDHCEGSVVYWAPFFNTAHAEINKDGHIVIKATLDGQPVDAIIDTGSPVSLVNETVSEKLLGIGLDSPGVETIGSGPDAMQRYEFKSLAFAGITVPGPRIVIAPDAMAEQSRKELTAHKMQGYHGNDIMHAPQLILGLDVLRRLHLYIAYKEKKVYLTAADAH